MNKKLVLSLLPHVAAVLLFVALSSIYFSPVWKGYDLKQGDIDNWRGMSKEIADFRMINEEEPLWTNSAFGGMPAYQISTEHDSNLLRPVMLVMRLGLPGPVGTLFLAMIGFYIFCMCLRINPWLGIAAAVAFGFSTINILYLGAGHTAKVSAIALMAPTLGGLILAFRGKITLGASLFMLFLGLQISANHLQMTYYLAILCLAVAIGEIVRHLIEGEIRILMRTCAALTLAALLSVLPGMSNLLTTQQYGQFTTRGKSDLTLQPDGTEKPISETKGLETNYILEYNFARGEQWSLLIPNAKGGQSDMLGNNKDAMRKVGRQFKENIARQNQYWGAQRFTGGAFYFGAISMILFVLGLLFLKDALRWPFLLLTVLALSLCIQDLSGLNQLFIDRIPLYNKFRDSKMILVLVQVMAPVTAVLFIQQLIRGQLWIEKKKYLFTGSGIVLIALIALTARPSLMGSYLSADEITQFEKMEIEAGSDAQQAETIEDYKSALIAARTEVFSQDARRTLVFACVAIGLVVLASYRLIREMAAGLALAALGLIDLWNVDQRYLSNSKERNAYASYEKKEEKAIPYQAGKADYSILERESSATPGFEELQQTLLKKTEEKNRNTSGKDRKRLEEISAFGALNLSSNFRVLSLGNPFSDGRTSYFHKSLGGYHGAKLKRYQELIDFHLQPEISMLVDSLKANRSLDILAEMPAINMLNTRYIIYNPEAEPIENPFALGNAWFINETITAPTADEEITRLATIDPSTQAVVPELFKSTFSTSGLTDSTASIVLEEYHTNRLLYKSKNESSGAAVFSEIYYPEGWICKIDGNETEYARVNYLLRGVNIPAGEHTIEWSFEPAVWKTGSRISLAGSSLLLLLLISSLFWNIREHLKTDNLKS